MSDTTKTKTKTKTKAKTKAKKKGQCSDCARRVSRDSQGRPHKFFDARRHEGSDM